MTRLHKDRQSTADWCKAVGLWCSEGKVHHVDNCLDFAKDVWSLHPNATSWIKPNEVSAPWHWHCLVTRPNGDKVLINVWPHKRRWQEADKPGMVGWQPLRRRLDQLVLLEEGG